MNSLLEEIPEFLRVKLINKYGEDTSLKIVNGYKVNRKLTFRVNNIKSSKTEIEKVLAENNISYKIPEFYEDGFIILNKEKEEIENLDIYKEGKIYMQSLSSMIPPIVLDPKEGEDILDMAAAPGGKTTQIASISNNKANLTAVERNNIRAERLKYNIEMQGAKVFVMTKDARDIDDFFSFDKILLDAPCSGSGIIDIKDDKYKKYFTEELIEKSKKTQTALLRKATKTLKRGGEIIYSTCSILEDENEDVITTVLRENKNIELVDIDFDRFECVPRLKTTLKETMCVLPNEEYEGFFVAKLRKKE